MLAVMARLYLIIIAVAAIAGAIFGKFGGPSAAPAAAPADDQVILVKNTAPASREAGELNAMQDAVVLEREANGHFYADVQVNNMPIHFMVDTGATGIALSRDDARKAGLSVSVGMFDVVAEGASGDVKGEWVTLDSVKLGQEEAKQVPAVILDGGQQSLLGQTFLQQFSSVEIKGDRMYLR
jgi:aspartyl protease family protein